jgi:hypothetical protein
MLRQVYYKKHSGRMDSDTASGSYNVILIESNGESENIKGRN